MTDRPEELRADGGICAPLYPLYAVHDGFPPKKRGDIFYITYPVQGRLRRWWFRRQGWSTEWTVQYEYVPVTDYLPKFTATGGGVSFK